MADDLDRQINISIDVDNGGALPSLDATTAAIGRLSDAADESNATFKALQDTYAEATGALQPAIDNIMALAKATDEEVGAADDLNGRLDATVEKLNAVSAAGATAAAAGSDALGGGYQGSGGSGGTGGLFAAGGAFGPEDDGGGIGSVFGIAHGVRAASGLASLAGVQGGAGAFTGTADVLYLAQGLRQLAPVLDTLNGSLADTPGLVGALSSAFISLDLPLAGVLGVLAPLVVAGGIAVGAFNSIKDTLDEVTVAADNSVAALDLYYDDLQKGPDAVKKAQTDLPTQIEQTQEKLNRLTTQVGSAGNQFIDQFGYVGGALVATVASTGLYGDTLQKLNDDYDKTQQHLIDLQNQLAAAGQAMNSDAFAAQELANRLNGVVDWVRNLGEALQQLRDNDADKRIAQATSDYQLKTTATSDQIRQQIGSLEVQRQAIERELAEGGLSPAEANKLKDQLRDLAVEEKNLTDNILPATAARETATQAAKDEAKAFQDFSKALSAHFDAVKQAQDQATAQSAAAVVKEAQDARQYTEGSLQDTEARLQIALKESRDEVKIKQDAADAVYDIERKSSQKVVDENQDYMRKQYDDVVKIQNDQAKLSLNYRQSEETDELQHEQKLADLRTKTNQDETQALLDGNFKKLYQDQVVKDQSIQNEDHRFAEQEQVLDLHNRQSQEDQNLSMQQLRASQLLADQRKLQDIQTAEDREIQQKKIDEDRKLEVARNAETQSLEDLDHAEVYKLKLLSQGLYQEIVLYQQTATAHIQLATQVRDATIALLGPIGPGQSTAPIHRDPLSGEYLHPSAAAPQLSIGSIIVHEVKDAQATAAAVQQKIVEVFQGMFG